MSARTLTALACAATLSISPFSFGLGQRPEILREWRAHGGPVEGLAFVPNGDSTLLVSGSLDTTVAIWDLDAGVPIWVFRPQDGGGSGETGTVTAVAVDPTGSILVVGSRRALTGVRQRVGTRGA